MQSLLILNIMPDKLRTQNDLLRTIGDADVETVFISLETHTYSPSALEFFRSNNYIPFSEVRDRKFDALIITGAPLEMYPYEDIDYFDELATIIRWAREGGARKRMYICWAAYYVAYIRYGIEKHFLPQKLSGVFTHRLAVPHPVMNGIPDGFPTPHSRNIRILSRDILSTPSLNILAQSSEAGVHAVYDSAHDDFLVFGHWEYAPDTLEMEYNRDSARGLSPRIPKNYFIGDNPAGGYHAGWIDPGKTFFRNFLEL